MPRFHCPLPLTAGAELDLPAGAARHVQVLRMQPGHTITLFDGSGDGEWSATILQMGRSTVQVRVEAFHATAREAARPCTCWPGSPPTSAWTGWWKKPPKSAWPASPRCWPNAACSSSRASAVTKTQHWQAVAVAACEQCGGNRVPAIHPAMTLAEWTAAHPQADSADTQRVLLSLADGTRPLLQAVAAGQTPVLFLSGPEGGLSPAEEALARAQGFAPVTLGPRVLRAETAPIMALSALVLG
jgi:16S rRNA (uracil1498-N3)-methyltransferase